jgi:hypothetical protein
MPKNIHVLSDISDVRAQLREEAVIVLCTEQQ